MTQPTTSSFLTALSQDVAAQVELRAAGTSEGSFLNKATELAQRKGYTLTRDQLRAQLVGSRASTEQELSLEELDAVAGGKHTDTFKGCGWETTEWVCKTNTKASACMVNVGVDQLLGQAQVIVQPRDFSSLIDRINPMDRISSISVIQPFIV